MLVSLNITLSRVKNKMSKTRKSRFMRNVDKLIGVNVNVGVFDGDPHKQKAWTVAMRSVLSLNKLYRHYERWCTRKLINQDDTDTEESGTDSSSSSSSSDSDSSESSDKSSMKPKKNN